MPDQIQRTRQHVKSLFAEMNSPSSGLSETVLIRDGHYCGHRFSNSDLSAVWFFEEEEIKVYDERRQLIRVESLSEEPLRRAA